MRCALLLGLLLAACGAEPRRAVAPPAPAPAPPPRLVVLLIIDQWPQWAFEAKRPTLHGGFERLLREGDWYTGHYPYGATLTAPGHTLLGSGQPPSASGIVANEWFDTATQARVKSVQDGSGFSPHYLRVPGLGDAMAAGTTHGKAVSISLKDRAAILPLGHAGLAVWYDHDARAWASSAPRPWLAEHLAAHPIAPRLAVPWTPRDPAQLAALSGTVDDQRGEVGEKGFGPTFPHDAMATRDPGDAVFAMPLGNTLVLETAQAAIAAEQLGTDDASPNLLVISLSANDYIGHGWGHESWESWDLTLRLDEELDTFLAGLDRTVGRERWAMILTSDHGAAPLPERTGGGRYTYDHVQDLANAAAQTVWGAGQWARTVQSPYVFLTAGARAKPAAERARAIAAILGALRAMPGLGRVEATANFAGHCETRTGDDFAICLMLDAERSGEVLFLPARNWITEEVDERVATAHGSLWDYDREVPVIMLRPGSRPTHPAPLAPTGTTIEMVRISTVIARWLGVPPPLSL